MANLTITVDEETLRRARIRALERGESVNRYLADQLRAYAGGGRGADRLAALWAVSDRTRPGSAGDGRGWTRDDLYAERTGVR